MNLVVRSKKDLGNLFNEVNRTADGGGIVLHSKALTTNYSIHS